MTFDSANSVIASNTFLLTIYCILYYTILYYTICYTAGFDSPSPNVTANALQNRRNRLNRLCNIYSTAAAILLLILSKPMLLLRCYFFLYRNRYYRYCRYHRYLRCWKLSSWVKLPVAFWVNTKRDVATKVAWKIRLTTWQTFKKILMTKGRSLGRSRCTCKIGCGLGKVTRRRWACCLPSRWPGFSGIPREYQRRTVDPSESYSELGN